MAILAEVSKNYGKLGLYINGEWVAPAAEQYFETTNPATGEVIAEAPMASKEQVDQALAALGC